MDNILLIMPPSTPISVLNADKVSKDTPQTAPPLGLLSIAEYIRRNSDAKIKVMDLNIEVIKKFNENKDVESIIRNILIDYSKNSEPNIIGISCIFNSSAGYIKIISKICKEIWKDSLVVVGGGYPTNMYEEMFDTEKDIDAAVLEEGEKPFLGLVKSKDKWKYIEKSSNWITVSKIKKGFKPKINLLMNLNKISRTPYELIEFEEYQKITRFHGSEGEKNRAISIMTSRGCPFRCVFCASHSVHGRKIRLISTNNVINEINRLFKEYNINVIAIEDDHFFIKKKRAIKILKAISNLNLSVEFTNGVAVHSMDKEMIHAMKKAGVKMVTLAVESGSDRVLKDIIHKPLNLNMVRNAVKLLREDGLYTRAFFIIGFPGETKLEIMESVRFMKETGFNWVGIMIASPIAGSELYKICKENNYLVSTNKEDFHFAKANIKTKDFTPEEIENMRYLINLEVNFVENYDIKNKHYETALKGLKDVIMRVPEHAFAHYFMMKCYNAMNRDKEARHHEDKYFEIINNSKTWKDYAVHFGLPILNKNNN